MWLYMSYMLWWYIMYIIEDYDSEAIQAEIHKLIKIYTFKKIAN